MNRLLSSKPFSADLAALLLRLILGGLFIYHGYQKIIHYNEYLAMSKSLIGLGAKAEYNLIIFAELFCGIFVTIGFLTRLTIIPILITMAIAYFVAHAKDAFMMKELPFTFLLLCIPVFVLESGKYSVDKLLLKK